MNSISGRAPAWSSARARSATNTAALWSNPTMTKSAGIAPAISIASVSTRAAMSAAVNSTRNPPIHRSSRWRDRSSVIVSAAVDVNRLAGDEAAVVADEKEAGGGDFVDMPLPTERDASRARHTSLVPFGIVPPCIDAAGGHHIGANIMRGEFRGERPRHADQTHLGRRDRRAAAAAVKGAISG